MRHHITGQYRPTDFFETSAMLITFILLGKYLEAAAKSRTSAAITRLLQLTPPTATLLTLDGKGNVASEQELPTSLVHRGDLLKVQLGRDSCPFIPPSAPSPLLPLPQPSVWLWPKTSLE